METAVYATHATDSANIADERRGVATNTVERWGGKHGHGVFEAGRCVLFGGLE